MKAKHFTKMVAWLLCVLMIAACLPVAALADTDFEGPIDVFETQLSNGENEIQIYSASTPGAAQYSGYAGTYTFAISTSVEGADGVMTVNGETIYSSETHEVVYAGEKSGAVINVTDIHIEDGEGQYVAGNVTITVTQIVEGNGTEDYPYELGDGNDMSLTIIVPAGKTVYYNSIYGGYTLTVSGANGFALEQGGVTYEDEYGEASLIVPEGAMQGTPAIIAITNNSDADQTYYVSYTEVTAETEELTLGVEASHTFAEDDEFHNFIYTAEKDGELQVYISSTTGWQLVVNEKDLYYSDMNGEEVPFSYNVTAGDELLISVNTQNDDNPYGAFPAGTITVKVAYKEEVVFPTGNAELKFSNRSMTFQSSLMLSMKVKPEVYEQYENVYVEIQIGDSSEVTTLYEPSRIEAGTNKGVYDIKGIAPYNLDMNMTLTLHGTYQGTENTFVFEMKPLDYCVNRLQNSSDSAFKTLIVDLLNYATASQEYEKANGNENIGKTAINSVLTEDQKAMASPFVAPEKITNTSYEVISNPTAKFTNTNVLLRDSINLTFRFTCSDITGVTVKVRVDESEWDISEFTYDEGTGKYTFYFGELYAYQLSEPVYATVYKDGVAISNTLRYSVSSYVAGKYAGSDTYLANLVKMMQCYGDSALAYFKANS